MRVELVIDGYNLLHAAGLARPAFAQGGLERARNRLLHRVRRGLTAEQRQSTTVVFDGRGSEFPTSPGMAFHGMLVMFSPRGLEADDTIEELILAHSFPKQLIVISSDHRLQKAARSRKAVPVDSEVFIVEIDRNTKGADQRQASEKIEAKPVQEMSAEDISAWVEEFSDIDVAEIDREVHREIRRETLKRKETGKKNTAKTGPTVEKSPEIASIDDSSPQKDAEPEFEMNLDFWESRIAELDDEEI